MASPLLFQELIDRLRREDFPVGPDQVLRMYALLARSEETAPEDLKTLLCPIFATSAEEQQRFYRAYDEFFSIRIPAAARKKRTLSIPFPRPATSTKSDTELPPPPPWKRFAIPALIVVVIVAILLALPSREPEPEPTDTAITQPVERPGQTSRPAPTPPPPRTNPWIFALAGGLVLFGAEVARTLLRWVQQRERRGEGRPFEWPLRDAARPSVFATSSFYRASRLLKGRELAEYERLDVRRTIDATIRALGDPTFAYALDRRVTEYLLLIERRSDRDHLAALATAMAQALARDGVLLEVYEYESDPRSCSKAGTTVRIATTDLHHRYPQHRLIVIGTATPFTDPVTGQAYEWIPRAFPWTWRVLLTPDDEGSSAVFVEPWFDVFALAENGLLRIAERWQYPDASARPILRRRSDPEPPDDLPSSVRAIEAALEPALFAWLLRCAVHPVLQWELTRALAPPMGDEERLRALIALARLPWFRQGRIPEPIRLTLVRRLGENRSEDRAARSVTLSLLAATPPPPPSSVAARTLQIEQLTHQLWRARGDRAELRPLVRGLRRFPPRLVERDRALMQMLRDDMPGQPVARRLPELVRHLLYRQGIPAFGAHSFLGLLLAVPLVVYAGAQLRAPESILPSIGAPRALTTRPTMAEPTGTDMIASVTETTSSVTTDSAAIDTRLTWAETRSSRAPADEELAKPAALSSNRGELRGVFVRDEISGPPIADVTVTAEGANPVVSFSNGTFVLNFPDKQPGETILLVVQKRGMVVVNAFELQRVLGRDPVSAPVVLVLCKPEDREEMARRYYRLRTISAITRAHGKIIDRNSVTGVIVPVRGIVIDENGKSVSGAIVRAGGVSTSTGADGQFELQIPAGQSDIKLVVEATGFQTWRSSVLPDGGEITAILTREE